MPNSIADLCVNIPINQALSFGTNQSSANQIQNMKISQRMQN
jgi:hypothetical protein